LSPPYEADLTPLAAAAGVPMPSTAHPALIEDYAMIGDCRSAALVSRSGSIDWLCWPRFDSPSVFSALLGTPKDGRWLIGPEDQTATVRRAYRPGTLVLETVFNCAEGEVALIDFMLPGQPSSSVLRVVEGRRGRVGMQMELLMRFDYGTVVPWVTRLHDGSGLRAIAGPDMVVLRTTAPIHGRDLTTVAHFAVSAGQQMTFTLQHGLGYDTPPPAIDVPAALEATEAYWTAWTANGSYDGPHAEIVHRSLITLKAMTYAPSGGIVAAPTTSLPEQLGGPRNWDYRYCWLRDAALALMAFMRAGHYEESRAWRDWLHRAVAGSAADVRIMYGLSGERRLPEWEVDHLPGYEGSRPVRIGNAAADQKQLDVYGEVMEALYFARLDGLAAAQDSWALQTNLIKHLETVWEQPDEGIWEMRSGRQHFVFSKVMAWRAMDCAVRTAEEFDLQAPLERWREVRARIHAMVCEQGFDKQRNSFVQAFGSPHVDASLLMLPLVNFLPADDPRMIGTVAAIEQDLLRGGFVLRYDSHEATDGLPPGEGAFLPCSFWLADNYALQGRMDEARALFERLIGLCNDVGLLAEEYDPADRRMLGNFPQAFTHTALISTALLLHEQAKNEAKGAPDAQKDAVVKPH
jgi:GH15 family glucan-1,4-alpha-glucosidase